MFTNKGLTISKGVVGQEHHQDGNTHLHAYVKLDKDIHTRDCRFFDITWEDTVYHPNIRQAKNANGSIKYCIKEDKEPLELGQMDYKQEIKARDNKTRILCKRLTDGENLNQVLLDDNHEMLKDYANWQKNIELFKASLLRDKPTCKDWLPNTWDLALPLEETTCKRRHYWFVSSVPNRGKTTFLEAMEEKHRCSWYNKSEVYQNIHLDSQFVLIDEYTRNDLLATTINAMCDGNYQYPGKGTSSTRLKKPYILICGNKNPEDLYPNAWQYIKARFIVINLDNEEQQQPEWPPILQVTKSD
jgi:hypothetical protein